MAIEHIAVKLACSLSDRPLSVIGPVDMLMSKCIHGLYIVQIYAGRFNSDYDKDTCNDMSW